MSQQDTSPPLVSSYKPASIALLVGGPSAEHKISVLSGRSLFDTLKKIGYQVKIIGVSKNGFWMHISQPQQVFEKLEIEEALVQPLGGTRRDFSLLCDVDVVFPLMHGSFGEDGTVQGILEGLNIPYLGCGVLASAVCMDKAFCKQILEQNGLNQLPFRVLNRFGWEKHYSLALNQINEGLKSGSLYVKPASMGSSIGISRVDHRSLLKKAIDQAFFYDNKVIIECSAPENMREMECGVIGSDQPQASSVGEVCTPGKFYDYKQKYSPSSQTTCIIPADLSPEVTARVRQASIRAYLALGCNGFARVDSFVDPSSERIFISEVNTIPGFTPISMFTKLWDHAGLSFASLINTLINLAIEDHRAGKKKSLNPNPNDCSVWDV